MAGPGVVIGKVSVKVTPDTSRFRSSLRAQLNKIEKTLRPIKVEVELVPQSVRDVRDELEDIIDDFDGRNIEFDAELSEAARRLTQAQLARLARPRDVPLIPRVSKVAAAKAAATLAALSGYRVLSDYVERFTRSLLRLDKNIPILAAAAEAIGLLGAMALAGASNLFALSASLAQIGGAALALPGILGGFAFGIGTMVAVLKDAGEILADVGERFGKLQDQLSEIFWEKAEQPIRRLVNTLFPQLREGLKGTADALGTYFTNLSDSLRRHLDGALEGMFANLNRSIEIAATGTEALASAMETLGTVGSSYLPRLAGWFVRISRQFDAWLTAAAEDGRLQGWIDAGIVALTDLGRVIKQAGRIFAGMSRAALAAGGSTLGTLADALERIADVVNREPFQSKMTAVFRAAHKAMDNLANEAGPGLTRFFETFADTLNRMLPLVGETVGKVLGGIADALAHPQFQHGLQNFLRGISEGLDGLLPALRPVAKALGSLGTLAGQLAKSLGPVLGAAFEALAGFIEPVATALVPVVDLLGQALTEAITALQPGLVLLGEALANLIRTGVLPGLMETLPPIVDAFTQLAVAVLPILAQILTELGPPLARIFEILAQALEAVLPILVPIVEFLIKFFGDALIGALEGAAQAIEGALDIIMGIFEVFAGIFTGDWERAWNGIKQIAKGVWDLIVGLIKVAWNVGILRLLKVGLAALKGIWNAAWNGIKSFFSGIWNAIWGFLKGIWNNIKSTISNALSNARSAVSGALSAIKNKFTSILSDVWNGVKDYLGRVLDEFKGLKDDVLGFFSNVGSWLYESGKSLLKGFADGIQSAAGWVGDKVNGILGGIRDKFPFSPAKEGPFSGRGWVYYSGLSISRGLADGILAARKEAERAADLLAASAYPEISGMQFQPDSAEYDDVAYAGNVTVYQTNYNPTQQPPSQQANEALQTAAAIGL